MPIRGNRPVIWISLTKKSITWYDHEGRPNRVKKFKSDKEMDKYIKRYIRI